MTRWQRRARLIAGIVAVSGAVGAYWMMGARAMPAPPPPITPLAPTVTSQVTTGQAAQTTGTRKDVSVDFAEQRTYTDGRTVATKVTVRVENRGGRSFVVTGNEGEIGDKQASIGLKGDVVLKASDGLTAWAKSATYADGEGIVRAPGNVRFTRAATKGSGVGFTFDKVRDVMWILDRAVVHVEGEPGGQTMDIKAGAFGEARRDRYMRLERGARIARPGQVIEADEIMVYLFPDRDEPDVIELRGNARITGGTDMGGLRSMRARDINLDYADDGRTVQHVALSSRATITLAGTAGARVGQRLSAEAIDISLGPDGAVTNLIGRDNVVATLPAAAGDAGPHRSFGASARAGRCGRRPVGHAVRGTSGI